MNYDTYVITRNVGQCRKCGDTIESRHRHDFVRCACGSIFLDGGTEYIRYGGDSLDNINLQTETRSKTRQEVLEDIQRYRSYWGDWTVMISSAEAYLESVSDTDNNNKLS